jgi:hypothetical protein
VPGLFLEFSPYTRKYVRRKRRAVGSPGFCRSFAVCSDIPAVRSRLSLIANRIVTAARCSNHQRVRLVRNWKTSSLHDSLPHCHPCRNPAAVEQHSCGSAVWRLEKDGPLHFSDTAIGLVFLLLTFDALLITRSGEMCRTKISLDWLDWQAIAA